MEIWGDAAPDTHSLLAAAAAPLRASLHKLGLVDGSVTVHMPGGKLSIEISKAFDILMTGPVTKVAEGTMSEEIFAGSIPL